MRVCGSVLVQMKEIFFASVREMHFLAMHFSLESVVCLCLNLSSCIIFKGLLKEVSRT